MASSSVSGSRELERQLRRMEAQVERAKRETLREWADAVTGTARQNAPVQSGKLRDSLDGRVYGPLGLARVGVWDQAQLEYASHVEHGTSSMREQPFLVPAFRRHRPTIARAYRDALRRNLGV